MTYSFLYGELMSAGVTNRMNSAITHARKIRQCLFSFFLKNCSQNTIPGCDDREATFLSICLRGRKTLTLKVNKDTNIMAHL